MGDRLGTRGAVGFFKGEKFLYKYISVKLAERSKASDLRSDTFQCEGSNPSLDILFWKLDFDKVKLAERSKASDSRSDTLSARVRIPHLTREVFKVRFISKPIASDLF